MQRRPLGARDGVGRGAQGTPGGRTLSDTGFASISGSAKGLPGRWRQELRELRRRCAIAFRCSAMCSVARAALRAFRREGGFPSSSHVGAFCALCISLVSGNLKVQVMPYEENENNSSSFASAAARRIVRQAALLKI